MEKQTIWDKIFYPMLFGLITVQIASNLLFEKNRDFSIINFFFIIVFFSLMFYFYYSISRKIEIKIKYSSCKARKRLNTLGKTLINIELLLFLLTVVFVIYLMIMSLINLDINIFYESMTVTLLYLIYFFILGKPISSFGRFLIYPTIDYTIINSNAIE